MRLLEVNAMIQAFQMSIFSTNTLRRKQLVANMTSLGKTEKPRKPNRKEKPSLEDLGQNDNY